MPVPGRGGPARVVVVDGAVLEVGAEVIVLEGEREIYQCSLRDSFYCESTYRACVLYKCYLQFDTSGFLMHLMHAVNFALFTL